MFNRFIEKLGKNIVNRIDYLAGVSALFVYSFIEYRVDKKGNQLVKEIIKKQVFFTGANAFLIISVISLSLGVVIILQTVSALSKFGAIDLVGRILNIVILRELGPMLTAIIIIGRSGTAIATEIGNMVVSHELEAIESMGINPMKFIVFPRVVGSMIAMTCLTIYFATVGILGGVFVASFLMSAPFAKFFNIMFTNMQIIDIFISLIKSIVFGAIIGTIAVYHGFKINLSSTEVPQAVTKAVVNSLIFTFIFNGLVTVLFYI